MDVKIEDEEMRAMMAKTIMDGMAPEAKEKMLTHALVKIMHEPDRTNYGGRKQTPLENAFYFAALESVRAAIKTKIEKDAEFRKRIDDTVSEAITKAFTGERGEDMIDAMADAVSAAFKIKDRY